MLDQLETMLKDTISHPMNHSTNVSPFPKNLLSVIPAKEAHIPSETTLLHQFVEIQARKHPQRIALEFVSEFDCDDCIKIQWTYYQLNAEGNKVAQLLLGLGTKRLSMIALCFDKCAEASFAILGILKAGCVFVAIDPEAPAERKRFIIQDSRVSLILAMRRSAEALGQQDDAIVICLDDAANFSIDKTSRARPTEVLQEAKESDLCYCLYTSGTSGAPKACLITHQNVVQAMMSFQRLFNRHWDTNSRFLQFASFHFDVSILEQFWSWSVGICVVSASRDLIFEDIGRAIRLLRITHLDLTPSLAKTLQPDDVPSICKGVFITGGEKLHQEILDSWGSKRCIYNG